MINWRLQPTACGGGALRIFDTRTGSNIIIMFTDTDKLLRMLDDIADGVETLSREQVPEAFIRVFPERF